MGINFHLILEVIQHLIHIVVKYSFLTAFENKFPDKSGLTAITGIISLESSRLEIIEYHTPRNFQAIEKFSD